MERQELLLIKLAIGVVLVLGAFASADSALAAPTLATGSPADAADGSGFLKDDTNTSTAAMAAKGGVNLHAERRQKTQASEGQTEPHGSTTNGGVHLVLLTPKEAKAAWERACHAGACIELPAGTYNSWTRIPPAAPAEDDAEEVGDDEPARVVTVSDVARFLPARGVLHAEPDGWAVVGVPANFWVDVSPMVAHGELLGERADVRFTPRLYTFSYGDGGERTTADAGRSWADLGVAELTATKTSHVFTDRAEVSAAVSVIYSAEYRVGDTDWQQVAGAVTAEAPAVDTLVVAERTVLTAGATPRRP